MRVILGLVLATLAGLCEAQTNSFVLPKGAATPVDGYSWWGSFGLPLPVHTQDIFDVKDVPVTTASLRGMALRGDSCRTWNVRSSTIGMRVVLAVGPNTPATASATFAANLGGKAKSVFSGNLNWPSASWSAGKPPPFAFPVPFQSPFIYVASTGKSLVVDIVQTSATAKYFFLDGVGQDRGWNCLNGPSQRSCGSGNSTRGRGTRTSGSLTNNGGGTLQIGYGVLPANSTGLMTLSLFGIGTRGSTTPLPLSLAFAGMPGCYAQVGLQSGIWVSMRADSTGWAWSPVLRLPAGLGGLEVFDQGIFRETGANAAGMVVTRSRKWHIGTLATPNVAEILVFRDTNGARSGLLNRGAAPVLQFTY